MVWIHAIPVNKEDEKVNTWRYDFRIFTLSLNLLLVHIENGVLAWRLWNIVMPIHLPPPAMPFPTGQLTIAAHPPSPGKLLCHVQRFPLTEAVHCFLCFHLHTKSLKIPKYMPICI